MANIREKIRSFHPGDFINMKAFLLVMVSFLMLTLLISVSIIFFSMRNRKIAEDTIQQQNSFVHSLDRSLDDLTAGDFIFPEQENLKQTQPHLQREPQRNWSSEEIERYWVDPADTGIGEISEHNHSLVEEMLGRVP